MTAPVAIATAAPRRRPTATARPAPELRVVRREVRRRPAGLAVALVVTVLFAALFLNAIFHSVLVSGQANLDELNRGVSTAETANQQRRLQVAELESPERIVDSATAAGMVLPDRTHWVMPQAPGGGAVSSTSDRASSPDRGTTDELAGPADPTSDSSNGR